MKMKIINTYFLSFRLCINDHAVCFVHMPTIQLSSFSSDWRKDIIVYHSSKNFISNPVVFIIPFLASTIWMGKVHPRSVRSRVRVVYTGKAVFLYLKLYFYILRSVQNNNFSIYFRCAPDWHSDHRDNSYVWFILVLGFLIPTVIIILSSLLTCANIREVSFFFALFNLFILSVLRSHIREIEIIYVLIIMSILLVL